MDGFDAGFPSSIANKSSPVLKISESDTESTTVSAASKATPPRKKILGERNEGSESILSDTRLLKTPKDIKANRASEPDGDDQNSAPDSTSSPYDPLTNYLSPRPKFLRYNPNRRREIFLRNENEIKDGKDRFSVSRSVSFESQDVGDEDGGGGGDTDASSQGDTVQPEDVEIVEDDEKIEEEGGRCLKGALKTLLVFFLLVLSTSYISSMNSPTPSPAMEAIEGLKLKIQNHTFGAMEDVQFGCLKIQSLIFGGTSMLISVDGVVELQRAIEDEDVPDEEMTENFRIQEKTAQEFEVFQDDMIQTLEPVVSVKDVNTDSIYLEEKIEDASIEGGPRNEEMAADEDITEWDDEDVPDKKMAENFGIQDETAEKNASFQDNLIQTLAPVVSEKFVKTDSISKQGKVGEVSVEGGAGNGEIVADDIAEPKVNFKLEITEHVVWASVFSIIVAALVLGFLLRLQKTPKTGSPIAANQCTAASLAAEKSSGVMAAPSNEGEDQIEKVESDYAKFLVQEASQEEFLQSQAPSVELLGEFVVEEMSSTPQINSMKNRMMTDSEKSNRISLSQALSSMDSPSYGSFTAEKSIRKKNEEGRDGEASEFVTTPLRRSSRIRNRGIIVSP